MALAVFRRITGFSALIAAAARRYGADRRGVVALLFALCMPVIISSAGIAVDLAQAYNVKTRLGNALDKAALAAGSTTGSLEEVEERVLDFVEANYPEGRLGQAYDVNVTMTEGRVNVSAHARVDTTFMAIFGYDYITVYEESEVVREMAGVEVVLVLDVTGSMAGNNITALRTASTNFLNIMFDRISDADYLKIGIVPFSNSVNVGRYGLGLTPSGGSYGPAFVSRPTSDPYVSPPSNIQYSSSTSTSVTTSWKGCILERSYPRDTTDAQTPNWGMYRYQPQCTSTRNGNCQSWRRDPNYDCPNSRIVPMTNVKSTLQSAINSLPTVGNTYGNVGMAWGWRAISPTVPFTEGVAYNDPDWTKTVIMMTDGDNTMHSFYSAYGLTSSHNMDADDLDDRFEEICTNMKEEGLSIYTITFQSGINNATREIFRRCASPGQYYNAPTNATLITVFEEIANHLSQLHISK